MKPYQVGIETIDSTNPLLGSNKEILNPTIEFEYSTNQTIIYETYDFVDKKTGPYQRKFKQTIYFDGSNNVTKVDKWIEITP